MFVVQIENTAMFQNAFTLIDSEELQDKAIKLIISVISLIPKSKNDLLLRPNVPEELQVHNRIVQMTFEKLMQSFASCQQALKEELGDEVQAYIKLYTKMGKKFIGSILYSQSLYVPFF